LHRRGGRTDVIRSAADGPRADPTLIRALRAAHKLVARDAAGLPFIESSPTSPHQRRLIRLAFLAPDLQTAILNGRQPRDLTLARLLEAEIPLCWSAQGTVRRMRTSLRYPYPCRRSGGKMPAPLCESGGAVDFIVRSVGEATLLIEVVMDRSMHGDEFLQASHAPEPQHRPLASSKRQV